MPSEAQTVRQRRHHLHPTAEQTNINVLRIISCYFLLSGVERGGEKEEAGKSVTGACDKININSLCQCIRQSDSWPEKVPAKWLLSTLFRVAILINSSEKGENAGKLI